MLKNIYIVDENGIMLYSKSFVKEKPDEALLVGFFTSIANFGREALGSIVKNIDLGENNKLMLLPIPEEKLLGVAIVSSNDNDDLVNSILKNILQDFIDRYSPNYDPDNIFHDEMEKIIEKSLSGRILRSRYSRLLISWVIVAPLTYGLIELSIFVTGFLYNLFNLERFLGSTVLFFTRFLPGLIGLSAVDILILFLMPNLILGYLAPSWKIGFLGSIAHLLYTIILFFNSIEPIFAYIVIGYLPLAIIFALFFLFIGIRYSSKKFLKK
ncbi:MAG: hypothetical protein ACFFE4_23195 [Candidatus Thorarchaeota archaeon]